MYAHTALGGTAGSADVPELPLASDTAGRAGSSHRYQVGRRYAAAAKPAGARLAVTRPKACYAQTALAAQTPQPGALGACLWVGDSPAAAGDATWSIAQSGAPNRDSLVRAAPATTVDCRADPHPSALADRRHMGRECCAGALSEPP